MDPGLRMDAWMRIKNLNLMGMRIVIEIINGGEDEEFKILSKFEPSSSKL